MSSSLLRSPSPVPPVPPWLSLAIECFRVRHRCVQAEASCQPRLQLGRRPSWPFSRRSCRCHGGCPGCTHAAVEALRSGERGCEVGLPRRPGRSRRDGRSKDANDRGDRSTLQEAAEMPAVAGVVAEKERQCFPQPVATNLLCNVSSVRLTTWGGTTRPAIARSGQPARQTRAAGDSSCLPWTNRVDHRGTETPPLRRVLVIIDRPGEPAGRRLPLKLPDMACGRTPWLINFEVDPPPGCGRSPGLAASMTRERTHSWLRSTPCRRLSIHSSLLLNSPRSSARAR